MKARSIYIGSKSGMGKKLKENNKLFSVVLRDQLLDAVVQLDKYEIVFFEVNGPEKENLWLVEYLVKMFSDKLLFVVCNEESISSYRIPGINDAFSFETPISKLENRVAYLLQGPKPKGKPEPKVSNSYSIPAWKRVFDIVFSLTALLLLLPLFLVLAVLIRIESKGKVFYAAKRVGTGYKIFDFYKFRSMYTDSDKRINELSKENKYGSHENELMTNIMGEAPIKEDTLLLSDESMILEGDFLKLEKGKAENSFKKFKNDPRVTRIGRFIRKTSIDELPQLFNVLKGDMSVVGNRPLPPYEAELLTADDTALRFIAPAGLTGLWQVSKRGAKGTLSAAERKQLDVIYAQKYTFWNDLAIVIKTVPAMLQHENV